MQTTVQHLVGKIWLFGAICVPAIVATQVAADTWISIAPTGEVRSDGVGQPQAPQVSVRWYDETGLDMTVIVPGFEIAPEETTLGQFVRLRLPDRPVGGEIGHPSLPVIRELVGVPQGATVELTVGHAQSATIDLHETGFVGLVSPVQGPASLDPTASDLSSEQRETLRSMWPQSFRYDEKAYRGEASPPGVSAELVKLGVVRGTQLYMLEVRPVAYDPLLGTLTVSTHMNIGIRFRGGEEVLEQREAAGLSRIVLNPPPSRGGTRSAGRNYLIVAAEDFAGSGPLNQFTAAKISQGYTVTTYTATPGTDRTAIKAYIQTMYGTKMEPDYVLLVGDAIGDLHTAVPVASSNTIPAWVGSEMHLQVTDLPYACMDPGDDWFPDFAIGRFPVRTVAQLQTVVDKTLHMQDGVFADPSFVKRALFLAHPDPDADAENLHDQAIDRFMTPKRIQSTKLYASQGAATQDVTDGFNAGCSFATYYGHSLGAQAWSAPYFNVDDIAALSNTGMYPFILAFSCSGGQYQYDGDADPGVVEMFVRAEDKGGVAGFGQTSPLSYAWSTWADLYFSFMATVYEDGIRELGPACQAATARLITLYGADDPACRHYAEGWVYQGDPSLSMPAPPAEKYLLITAQDYDGLTVLDSFIAAKVAQGLEVMKYVVPPGTSNTAIKTYIQNLWGTNDQPSYVLLVGDTAGFTATSNTIPHWDGTGDKSAATDNTYVCMDGAGDWYPDIPIGRFSVTNEAQLQAVVDKTLSIQNGNFSDPDYVKRGTFLANPSTYNTAEPTHDWVIANYFDPIGYQANKIYASDGGDTADVTAALNAGSLFTVYLGHSSSTRWWDPEFTQSNVNALNNNGLYGIAFGWSCNTASYASTSECIGETWIRASNKGAAAYISASTYIYWGSVEAWLPSAIHEKAFFAAFFEDDIWEVGRAWQAGLYRFLTEHGNWDGDPAHGPQQNEDVIHNFFEEFVVLGDPALRLPQPTDFAVEPATNPIEFCASTDRAVSVVGVRRKGAFDERVTLQVTGAPAGTTSSFHGNAQVPPYSSIMAVDGISPAMAGNYTLSIFGTATGGSVRSADVALNIASHLPGDVILSTPADAASGVSRNPELTWQSSSQASTFDVEIALDSNFTTIVDSATVAETNHTVGITLDSDTIYYWRVRAMNGCGESSFSSVFAFTTLEQADYFTQQFTSGFDLDNTSIEFIPDGSGNYYRMCSTPIATLPIDPAGGTSLPSNEDFSVAVTLSGGDEVEIYGNAYGTFYVGENGYITFGGGDNDWNETLSEHFGMRRVSALYRDLSVPAGGTISWQQLTDRVAVTWDDVPEYNTSNSNTLQIELFYNGKIRISWLSIAASGGIVGLSNGGGMPADFVPTGISAAQSCTQQPTFTVSSTPASQDICSPSNATYAIDVLPVLGFSETVTLSTSNLPTGAIAGFAPNTQVPPFTSTLTISNTAACPPGSYEIGITGTAAGGMERLADVHLGIAADAPSPVTLLSPPNGQVESSRTPRLTWDVSPGAPSYYLQIATDALFEEVVYTKRTTGADHTVEETLDGLTTYYWHVRATNKCGEGDYSSAFSFVTNDSLLPTSYDVLNGQFGTYAYYDSSYDGSGDPGTALSPLSGGLGELTDGEVASGHWNATPTPYVGWQTVDPTMTFHFAHPVSISKVILHLDDSGGGSGVAPPVDITIGDGVVSRVYPVIDPPGDEPFFFTCDNVDLVGDSIEVTIADYDAAGGFMMLSEVQFRGNEVGACCDQGTCSVTTQDLCITQNGVYQGNGTDCDPNPCATYYPECLIISEVVEGRESGDCPRWIEITNTGAYDFAFVEGGIIVQQGASSDVKVDVDLSGFTIPAGDSFVVNSNVGGACTGAFGVYPTDPDVTTPFAFGFGDERFILTDTDDGSNLIDIYGEFGEDGTGTEWEFTRGYSFRRPSAGAAAGADFDAGQWYFGGAESLAGDDPTTLLLTLTSPGTHTCQQPCTTLAIGDIDADQDVDLDDCALMCECMDGPDNTAPPAGCPVGMFAAADLDLDGDVDLVDFGIIQMIFASP